MRLLAAAAAPATRLVLHTADAKLLERVLAETRVARTPSRPSVISWFGALAEALVRWLGDLFSQRAGLATGLVDAAEILAISILALAAVLLLLSIARRVRALRERRGASVPSLEWREVAPDAQAADALEWRRRLEARLARGDIPGALEALWWWLAVSLSPAAGVDASWTTRELLQKARRPELLPMGSGLDVLLYGPVRPSPAQIRACLARFEKRLA